MKYSRHNQIFSALSLVKLSLYFHTKCLKLRRLCAAELWYDFQSMRRGYSFDQKVYRSGWLNVFIHICVGLFCHFLVYVLHRATTHFPPHWNTPESNCAAIRPLSFAIRTVTAWRDLYKGGGIFMYIYIYVREEREKVRTRSGCHKERERTLVAATACGIFDLMSCVVYDKHIWVPLQRHSDWRVRIAHTAWTLFPRLAHTAHGTGTGPTDFLCVFWTIDSVRGHFGRTLV